jgi:hypothetical protein
MAEATHQKMSEDNSTRLRITASALAVIYVATFLGGFLQATPFNFLNYIFFFLLCMGGILLMSGTVKSTQTRTTRGFLFLNGIAATLLLVFFVGYEWFRLTGGHDIEASLEALLYLLTLLFWVGAIGSLVLIRRRP